MTVGYYFARYLMKDLDWKLRVTMNGENIEAVKLYHPESSSIYTVRRDSFKRFYGECRVVCADPNDPRTAILCYDHNGSDESLI